MLQTKCEVDLPGQWRRTQAHCPMGINEVISAFFRLHAVVRRHRHVQNLEVALFLGYEY